MPQCFGTDDEIKLGAYAVTEPQAGSDVKSLRTTAKLDGDEWVLNGTKVFITNGGIADVHVVVATVDPELGHRGQASFVIGPETPGLRQGNKETKIGIRASHTAEVILEDCRIPVEQLLGGMDKLEQEARARPLGPEGRLLERARDLRDDPADRRRLGARHRPGRLRVDPGVPRRPDRRGRHAGALRSSGSSRCSPTSPPRSTRRACSSSAPRGWAATGMPMTGGQGSMSKLKAGDVTMWATTTLMDLVGPYAQTTDCPLEKWFRDAKIYQLFEGTAQVQRLVISRMQAKEYRERLEWASEVAAEATAPVAA